MSPLDAPSALRRVRSRPLLRFGSGRFTLSPPRGERTFPAKASTGPLDDPILGSMVAVLPKGVGPESLPASPVRSGDSNDATVDVAPRPSEPSDSVSEPRSSHPTVDVQSDTNSAAPRVAQQLGRFRIRRTLGMGGMGVVHDAYDLRMQRAVALKVLRDPHLPGRDERIRMEAQALARLNHPNVVEIFDVGKLGSRIYIAMELVDGPVLTRWQEHSGRTIEQILDMYIEAGQGLLAAHRAGLVHRDFKPDNVIVGRDGRPRVLDFGLVVEGPVEGTQSEVADLISGSGQTCKGRAAGTPAYMAPEQHLGDTITPAADQFAFCVALWEALTHRHPFGDGSRRELFERTCAGELEEMPRVEGLRPAVGRVLTRGLAPAAEDRYPSMQHLLDDLDRARRAPRRPFALLAGLSLTLGVAGAWLARDDSPCARSPLRDDGTWSTERRAALEETLSAHPTMNPAFVERLLEGLDVYAEHWSDSFTDLCRGRDRGSQSSRSSRGFDAAMSCLDRRRSAFDQLVGMLEEGDPLTSSRAHIALERLAPPRGCEARASRDGDSLEPEVPELAVEVKRVRTLLDAFRSRRDAGANGEAAILLDRALRQGSGLEFEPLRAELDLARGQAAADMGRHEEALERLEQAYLAGKATGHDQVVADAALELADVEGRALQHHGPAWTWAERACAEADRLEDPSRQIRCIETRARIMADRGELEQARTRLEAALERLAAEPDPSDPLLMRIELQLGRVLTEQGRFDEARSTLEGALARGERALGEGHLELSSILDHMAELHHRRGEIERALELGQAALERRTAILPPHHPDVASAHASMGRHAFAAGKLERAVEHTRRARDIARIAWGDDSAAAAVHDGNLASFLLAQNEPAEALEGFRRVTDVFLEDWGPEHALVITGYTNMGIALRQLGRLDQARDALERALEAAETGHGADSLQAYHPLAMLAVVLAESGEPTMALPLAVRGLDIAHRTLGAESPHASYATYAMGSVVFEVGDPVQAERWARAALALRPSNAAAPDEVAETRLLLGRALVAQGRAAEAEPLLAEARRYYTEVPHLHAHHRRALEALEVTPRGSRQ